MAPTPETISPSPGQAAHCSTSQGVPPSPWPGVALDAAPKTAPEGKKLWLAYVLWLPPLGIAGCHHYYLGRTWYGIFYTFFLGNFLLGWTADAFRMRSLVKRRNEELWMMKHYDVKKVVARLKYLDDCYILQFPLGMYGLVHAFLSRTTYALLYLVTLGGVLVLWLLDFASIPKLVREHNSAIQGYDDYVVKLERLKGGYVEREAGQDSLSFSSTQQGAGTQLRLHPHLVTAHTPSSYMDLSAPGLTAGAGCSALQLPPPDPAGAPPSYDDVMAQGTAKFPILRLGSTPAVTLTPDPAGVDNVAFELTGEPGTAVVHATVESREATLPEVEPQRTTGGVVEGSAAEVRGHSETPAVEPSVGNDTSNVGNCREQSQTSSSQLPT